VLNVISSFIPTGFLWFILAILTNKQSCPTSTISSPISSNATSARSGSSALSTLPTYSGTPSKPAPVVSRTSTILSCTRTPTRYWRLCSSIRTLSFRDPMRKEKMLCFLSCSSCSRKLKIKSANIFRKRWKAPSNRWKEAPKGYREVSKNCMSNWQKSQRKTPRR